MKSGFFLRAPWCGTLLVMRFLSILPRALAILAVIGLVLGGAAAPAAAGPAGVPAMAAMADGMAPCDDQAPDCGDMTGCPFMVGCVAKSPQSLPDPVLVKAPQAFLPVVAPRDSWDGAGLTIAPPARPPKA